MFNLALCQFINSQDKAESIKIAEKYITEAASNGADMIVLPEMWNCPYSNRYFREYAETLEGKTIEFMSRIARELKIYLIGGSVPELDKDKVYNTAFCFDREGELIGRHRKAHLFDVDIEGGIRFKESEVLSSGNSTTVIDTEFGKIGVALCYDIRFPEFFRKMAIEGAKLVVLPASFNMTTGPAHWELSIRARAVDNQVYLAASAPARNPKGKYLSYANSCIVDPWGVPVAKAGEDPCVIYGDIDFGYVDSIRKQLPLLQHRRPELY